MSAATSGNTFSVALVALLKGVVYQESDPALWGAVLELAPRLREHLGWLGLDLHLDESEGYAFLRQRPPREGEPELPRLVHRRPLGFQVSLLLVLLRKKLAEFDASGAETRLVLSRHQIHDLIRVFLPETADEARAMERLDVHLNRILEMGFLRRLPDQQLEVRRILKTFVDAQWIAGLESGLGQYRAHLVSGADEP